MEILEPRTLEEAVEVLGRYGDEAKVIAGGTAVVLMLQNRLISPGYLVSLGRLDGLDRIGYEPGTGLRIGALATIRAGERSPVVREQAPVLAEAFGQVASVRVRNAATVGGNLSEADYASDPPGVLVGLRARVTAVSSRGSREIALGELFKDFYETALAEDEILTELIVPERSPGLHGAYLKFVTRSSEDRPCLGASAFVDLDEQGICRELRVVVGAVAETPREVPEAEALARGERLTDELVREVAERYAQAIDPLSDLRGSASYRKQMIPHRRASSGPERGKSRPRYPGNGDGTTSEDPDEAPVSATGERLRAGGGSGHAPHPARRAAPRVQAVRRARGLRDRDVRGLYGAGRRHADE
jgi:carbon-monoxide dehydrogenase medium subunit